MPLLFILNYYIYDYLNFFSLGFKFFNFNFDINNNFLLFLINFYKKKFIILYK